MNIFFIIIVTGALSFGPALDTVRENRQTKPLLYALPQDFNYPCIVGVPYDYHWLMGREVFFVSEDGMTYGPWGVVDYEAPRHAGQMKERHLAADVLCEGVGEEEGEFVHMWGSIVIKSSRR